MIRKLAQTVLSLGVAIVTTTACLAQQPYGVITARSGSDDTLRLPRSVRVDLADLAESLGAGAIRPEAVSLAAESDGGLQAVSWQLASPDTGDAVVSFLPPEEGDGAPVRLRLLPAGAGPEALEPEGSVVVTEAAGTVTVRTGFYEITHARDAMGGLPSRIVWTETGKRFDTFALNDRLYKRDLGGFSLRNDESPTVEVLARGPLAAVVRVRARYLGGQAPPTNPRAEYLFHYFAGSPVVRVEALITQDAPFAWDECHLVEVNFPDESFTRWLNPENPAGADLLADETSHVAAWGALADDASLLGMFGRDAVRIYDGRGGYGTYLHGPWVGFSERELALSTHLYLNDTTGGIAELQRVAHANLGAVDCSLSTSVIEGLLGEIRASGSVGSRWAAALLARNAGSGKLADTTRRLRSLAEAVAKGQEVAGALQEAPGERLHVLQGDRLLVAVRTAEGNAELVSLYDMQAERELLWGGQPLWRATFRAEDGETVEIDSSAGLGAASTSRNDMRLRLEWTGADDERLAGVVVRQELAVEGSELTAKLRVANDSAASLLDVAPLTVELARLGESGDDCLLCPKVSGGLYRDPTASLARHAGRYPSGWTTFQFGAYYDAEGGLYFGCHDPLAWTKEIDTRAEAGGVVASMRWHAEDATRPGNDFVQSGRTVLRLFDGEWFEATRIYRDWAAREAQWWPHAAREDTPEWLKDTAVWVNASGHAKDCVPQVRRFAEYMGVPTALHWYSWHEIPFDVNYPHYFPTKPGFAEGVAELQAAGVRVMPYINGRLWDTGAEDFQVTAFPAAAKQENGENYIEEYGSGAKLAPMCPTTVLWRNTVKGIVLRLCGPECNVDGVYIDQVAAAAPALCHDPTHGHPLRGGSWWTEGGYWPLLAQLREEMHALSPEKMITTECTAESYARWLDAYLTWNFWYDNQVPVIAALYGGRLQLFGRTGENGELTLRTKTAQALVWGEQLGWYGPGVIDDPVAGPFLRRCARVRYHLRGFLARGEMQRPPTLSGDIPDLAAKWRAEEATYPAVQAGAWSAPDGRLAVIFANAATEAISFTWELDGRGYRLNGEAVVYTENGLEAERRTTLRTPGEVPVTLEPCGVVAFVVESFDESVGG